jgi:quercetin dioxygenase-like cupin family protein
VKVSYLKDMKGGWFVGAFQPAAMNTDKAEVACKYYKQGDTEPCHYHKVATELTVVVSGVVEMFDRSFGPGSIIEVEPGEKTGFRAVTDATTVVVKVPSVMGDKYLA